MANLGTVFLVVFLYVLTLACYLGVTRSRIALNVYRNAVVLYAVVLALVKFLPEAGEGGIRLVPLGGFWEDRAVGYYLIELILSTVLLMPLGFLSGMHSVLKGERGPVLKAVLLGATVSLVAELIQLFPLGKVFAVDHILCNTLGAFCGVLLFAALSRTERMKRALRGILYPDRGEG